MRLIDFVEKLESFKDQFKKENGRDMKTIDELEKLLSKKMILTKKTKVLKSLKGFDF